MTDKSFTLDQTDGPERIAKRIARAGICSRRAAEARILDGRVSVNGAVIDSPALNVGPDDKITIDGKPLPSREPAGRRPLQGRWLPRERAPRSLGRRLPVSVSRSARAVRSVLPRR